MRILLDTCSFLWSVSEPERLSSSARKALLDPGNDVFLSAVSAWEISVKEQLGTLVLADPSSTFIPKYRALHGFAELALDETAVLQLSKLPLIHKDPFDRMLICQAIALGMAIATPDPVIARYPVQLIW